MCAKKYTIPKKKINTFTQIANIVYLRCKTYIHMADIQMTMQVHNDILYSIICICIR